MANQASVAGPGAAGPFGDHDLARAVLADLPVAVWIKDPDGRYLACNRAFEQVFGVVEAEILGRVDTDFIDAGRSASFRRQDLLAMSSDRAVTNLETVVRAGDGQVAVWETTKTALRDRSGKVIGVYGVGFDVTDRETALAGVERERGALVEAEALAHLGGFDHDLETDHVAWSDELYRIFGLDPLTFVPSPTSIRDHVHPDDAERVDGVYTEARAAGRSFAVEHRIVAAGQIKHVEARGRFEHDPAGRPTRAVGTIHDLTDRARAAQRIENFYHLVERASDAIVLIDTATGRVVEANRKAATALRGDRATIVGTHVWDIVEQISERWWRTIVATAEHGPPEPGRYDLRRLDGTVFPAEVSVEIVEDDDGRFVFAAARDISDRVLREELLIEAAEQYRALIGRSIDGFVLVDERGRILDVNDVFCEQSGYTRDELFGMPIHELDVDESPDSMRERMERVVAEGGEIFEAVHRRKDGTRWPAEIAITHATIQGGRFFAFVRDLTEWNEVEAALRLGAERWATLLAGTPDGFVRHDPTGIILEANERYCELVGRSHDDLIGRSVVELDANMTDVELAAGLAALQIEGNQTIDTIMKHADGTTFPVEISVLYSPVQGGQVFSFVRDISDRVRMTSAIERSAKRFDAVMAGNRDGFLVVDAEGVVVDANDRYLELSGYRRDDLVGMRADEVDARQSGEEVRATMQQIAEQGSALFETAHRHPDGSVWPVEVSTSYADLDGGRFLNFVRDLTDRHEAEAAIRSAADRHQALLHGSSDGFARMSLDGTILEVNERLGQMLGVPPETLVGASVADIDVNIDDAQVELLAELAQEIGSTTWVSRVVRGDGTELPVEVNLIYSPDDGGQVFSFSRDISERVESERAIREASDRFTALLAGTTDAFCLLDAAGRVLDVNDEFCRQSGFDRAAALELTGADLAAEDDLTALITMVGEIREAGSGFRELLLRRRDGTSWPVEVSLTFSTVEGGRIFAFIRDISERREAERRIEFLAYHDVLTGLPNRPRFSQQLRVAIERAQQDDTLVAVCYLDLDGFKPVNDRFGHEVGDVLLVQLGQRLRRALRPQDQVARFGGDEFVVVLTGLSSLDHVREQARHLVDVVAEPFEVEGRRVHLSASIGVTVYPDDDGDEDALLRHADQAMYRAKECGKSTFELFDPGADDGNARRRQQIAEFEHALHDDQLVLHYQPRIELRTGRVVGMEALARWRHPTRGLLPPAAFLPLIEASPLEFALDEWVLATALDQLETWEDAGLDLAMSVNITPRHIAQWNFPDYLAGLLDRHRPGLAAKLELEILETGGLGQISEVAAVMHRCAALGITFSLDDFGTGYSSLTYFHSLPISVLKIDQNFVRGLLRERRDLDIVEGVIQLATALDRPVVAEGVESIEIGVLLHHLGCQFAQGFGIARPMAAEAVPGWLAAFGRDDGEWHTLASGGAEGPGASDVVAAAFAHRRWANELVTYLQSGPTGPVPRTSAAACPVSDWTDGAGAARYGHLPSFASIEPAHIRVHELGRDLVLRSAGGTTSAEIELTQFCAASDHFQQALEELVRDVTR